MTSQIKFHIVFSFVMGALMTLLMTFVVTAVNVGITQDFLFQWGRAFVIAYAIVVPVIFFAAPVARKITAKLLGMPE